MTLLERLKSYIDQMAPHQRQRSGGLLISEAADEIKRGQWQPMNTAPRDSKPILLFDGSKNGGVFVGHEATFPKRRWVTAGAFQIQPTHWMPLPAGPNV